MNNILTINGLGLELLLFIKLRKEPFHIQSMGMLPHGHQGFIKLLISSMDPVAQPLPHPIMFHLKDMLCLTIKDEKTMVMTSDTETWDKLSKLTSEALTPLSIRQTPYCSLPRVIP